MEFYVRHECLGLVLVLDKMICYNENARTTKGENMLSKCY